MGLARVGRLTSPAAGGTQLICKSGLKFPKCLELRTVRWCSSRGSMAGLSRFALRGMCCILAFWGAPMVFTVWPTIFSALGCSHVADSFARMPPLAPSSVADCSIPARIFSCLHVLSRHTMPSRTKFAANSMHETRIRYVDYLKASPLPPAPLAVAGFMVAGLAAWQYSDRLAGLLGFAVCFWFC